MFTLTMTSSCDRPRGRFPIMQHFFVQLGGTLPINLPMGEGHRRMRGVPLVLKRDNPMTDPWCCEKYGNMDPINIPSGLFNIAMENGPFIDGSPIKNGDFPWRTVSTGW